MITPTPEAFLSGPSDPEEDTTAEDLSPLESIAGSLRGIHVLMDRFDADRAEDPCQAHASALHESQELCDNLREANADLADKHRAVFELVEEIEGIVKPSTSKLANSVREAIGRWKAPSVEPAADTEPAVEPVPVENAVEMGSVLPNDDDPAERWRAYARNLGYTGADVDQMNRSQIRTMLGMAQPVAAQ